MIVIALNGKINRAFKYSGSEADLFLPMQKLQAEVHTYDELESLLRGIHYIESCSPMKECFYFDIDMEHKTYTKTPFDFSNPYPYLAVNIGSGVSMLAVYSPTEYRRITGTR